MRKEIEEKLARITELSEIIANAENELESILSTATEKPKTSVSPPKTNTRTMRRCKVCNESGHNKASCKRAKSAGLYQAPPDEPDEMEIPYEADDTEVGGVDSMTFTIIKDSVLDEDKTSKQVAEELGIPIAVVNKVLGFSNFRHYKSALRKEKE